MYSSLLSKFCSISMLLLLLHSNGIFLSDAQSYGQGVCDSTRLLRCQQDILRDIQSSSSAPISQYPINSGPPYSPQSVATGFASQSTCRLVRVNLDCLLATTPACFVANIQPATNTDVITRAKRFLEQNACNPEGNWQNSFCFKSAEIRNCEERFGFTSPGALASVTNNLASAYMQPSATACINYQSLKQCAEQHARMQCKATEADMINEYLIDRASDLSWRCLLNSTASSGGGSYYAQQGAYNGANAQVYTPYDQQRQLGAGNIGGYGASPYGAYGGYNSLGRPDTRNWDRYNNPFGGPDGNAVGGGAIYRPGMSPFERLTSFGSSGALSGDLTDMMSDCPNRAAPYTRECEDNLLEQQRSARESRTGNELQRRICCALYQYRDCISRVVVDRCTDSSSTAVDILMSTKKRDLTFSCRDFSRDICSGSQHAVYVSAVMVILSSLLSTLFVHSLGSVSHSV